MKQLTIDFSQPKTHTALTENGSLIEVVIDDPNAPQILGNVYTGLVKRVLPNGFAFIDIGQESCAFMDLNARKRQQPLKQGDHVTVQIARGGRGGKGAIATTELCLAGRYTVVCYPSPPTVGVSKKIEDKAERRRLKKLVRELLQQPGEPPDTEPPLKGFGVIVRTCAAGAQADALSTEINNLAQLAKKIHDTGKHIKAPAVLYEKAHYLYGTLQALMDDEVDCVAINNAAELGALAAVLVDLGYDETLLKLVDVPDIFTHFHIDGEFRKAFDKRVWLKSGGHIVIEQTEACVVIDVNTGRSIRKLSQFTTNCEAAVEIARQLRLRNLSGMIIIDFIDMKSTDDKHRLQQILEQAVKTDRVRVNVVGLTELGLMQLTRKRTGNTLGES